MHLSSLHSPVPCPPTRCRSPPESVRPSTGFGDVFFPLIVDWICKKKKHQKQPVTVVVDIDIGGWLLGCGCGIGCGCGCGGCGFELRPRAAARHVFRVIARCWLWLRFLFFFTYCADMVCCCWCTNWNIHCYRSNHHYHSLPGHPSLRYWSIHHSLPTH